MTEPAVASSDATNMAATAVVNGDEIVINGRSGGAPGLGTPTASSSSSWASPIRTPTVTDGTRWCWCRIDTPGVTVERMLVRVGITTSRYGHGEVCFTDVRLPLSNVIAGPGRGFAIAQGRLGPGRIHHCMRLIGLAEMLPRVRSSPRATSREAFGKPLANLGGNRERIADARIAIDQARLLVLHTAWKLDAEAARRTARPRSRRSRSRSRTWPSCVIDMAIQLHGGAGLSDDLPPVGAWTSARSLRLADGPDEVHRGVVARLRARQVRHPPVRVLVTGAASGLGAALSAAFRHAATRCCGPT